MPREVDVVVVGMGPGGEDVAGALTQAGKSVVGIEAELVGGECPYWGCIPSKMLLRAANLLAETRRLPGLRPELRRNDRGGGFTNASELGGFDEFCEFLPSRASNWATRAAKAEISSSRLASNSSNWPTVGSAGTPETGTTGTKTYLRGKTQYRTRRACRQSTKIQVATPTWRCPNEVTAPRPE